MPLVWGRPVSAWEYHDLECIDGLSRYDMKRMRRRRNDSERVAEADGGSSGPLGCSERGESGQRQHITVDRDSVCKLTELMSQAEMGEMQAMSLKAHAIDAVSYASPWTPQSDRSERCWYLTLQ